MKNSLLECVYGEFNKTDYISNGDEIKYRWKCDEDLIDERGFRVKYEDITIIAEGLGEVEKFDAFEGIELDVIGVSGSGELQGVETETANKYSKEFSYLCDVAEGLSNGDVITLTIVRKGYSDWDAEGFYYDNNIMPAEETKEYIVEGLPSYVESASEIPQADMDAMVQQATDEFNSYVANNFMNGEDTALHYTGYETVSEFKYMGNYFMTSKLSSNSGQDTNRLILVYGYKANVTGVDCEGESYDADTVGYWYVEYDDVTITDDGIFIYDCTDYEVTKSKFNLEIEGAYRKGFFYNEQLVYQYPGYYTYDYLINDLVTANVANYNVEDNIDKSLIYVEDVEITDGEENVDDSVTE